MDNDVDHAVSITTGASAEWPTPRTGVAAPLICSPLPSIAAWLPAHRSPVALEIYADRDYILIHRRRKDYDQHSDHG